MFISVSNNVHFCISGLCRPSSYRDEPRVGWPMLSMLRMVFARRPISRPEVENFPRTKC